MSLKTLREIAAESNAFEAALKSAADVQAWDSRGLIAWLHDCVAHGRYLPSGSPEREALQALVDYWTSRLLQLDHSGSDDLDHGRRPCHLEHGPAPLGTRLRGPPPHPRRSHLVSHSRCKKRPGAGGHPCLGLFG